MKRVRAFIAALRERLGELVSNVVLEINSFHLDWSQLKFFKSRYLFRFMSSWVLLAPFTERAVAPLNRYLCGGVDCGLLFVPINIRLSALSTFCLLLSYVVYQWKCPPLIKAFDDFGQFSDRRSTASTLLMYVKSFYYDKLVNRRKGMSDHGEITFWYDNVYHQRGRPSWRRNLAFVGRSGRWMGIKSNLPSASPSEINGAMKVLFYSGLVDGVDRAIEIMRANLEIYAEFAVNDGPDGEHVVYVWQLGLLYFYSWSVVDILGTSRRTLALRENRALLYQEFGYGAVKVQFPGINNNQIRFYGDRDEELRFTVGVELKYPLFFGYFEVEEKEGGLEAAYEALAAHFDGENQAARKVANVLLGLGLLGWLWCVGSQLVPYLLALR